MANAENIIKFDDFNKVDIRIGRIVKAENFPEARVPSLKLLIDFGELGIKKSSAHITDHYTVENLAGKAVMAVVNFPKKQIANFMSEVLVLGFPDDCGKIILAVPDSDVPIGTRLR
ncbi:MAG: tRNA-binding protein [Candidatus Thermoplasmatota archaeon]|nr:tRNA-binding protein [Candidatus Thermoplasmatota archaeon]